MIRLVLFIAVIQILSQAAFSQSPPKVQKTVRTADLGTQVELVGPLGVPLGKLVEIEGVAETRAGKVSNKWLLIDTVNGQKLSEPVKVEYNVYHWANVTRLEDGARLTLNAYQQIGMRGLPEGVIKQTTPVSTGWPHGLYTWIVVVNQTAPEKLRFRNTYYDNVDGGHPLDSTEAVK